jgi:hypothetical protein
MTAEITAPAANGNAAKNREVHDALLRNYGGSMKREGLNVKRGLGNKLHHIPALILYIILS